MYGKLISAILIVLIVIYIWRVQYYQIKCQRIFLDDWINSGLIKTGDLIIFKAHNNFNSIITTSYFGHIGIIVVDKGVPMIFEANGIEKTPMKEHRSKTGMFYTPLIDRVRRYKGRCFWRSLNEPIKQEYLTSFPSFMKFCMENMYYDYNVVQTWLCKIFGEKCNLGTNCAELVFLSWIKLGLLNMDSYEKINTHYLKYVCNTTKLDNGYSYSELIEIVDEHYGDDVNN